MSMPPITINSFDAIDRIMIRQYISTLPTYKISLLYSNRFQYTENAYDAIYPSYAYYLGLISSDKFISKHEKYYYIDDTDVNNIKIIEYKLVFINNLVYKLNFNSLVGIEPIANAPIPVFTSIFLADINANRETLFNYIREYKLNILTNGLNNEYALTKLNYMRDLLIDFIKEIKYIYSDMYYLIDIFYSISNSIINRMNNE